MREAHHLVLERRAVARADAGNLPVEERRLRDVLAHQRVHALRRVHQVTGNLRTIDRAAQKREGHRRIVPALLREAREVDAAPVQSRRRAGLQTSPGEAERLQRLREITRRRLTRAPRGLLIAADVHQPVEERTGGHDERIAPVDIAVLHRESGDLAVLDENPPGLADNPGDVRLALERRAHPRAVDALVGLRARRPHGGPAAAIEQLELDRRLVDRDPPSIRRARRSRGPGDPSPCRRSRDCTACARSSPSTTCRSRRRVPCAPPPTPLPRRRAPLR